MPTNYIEAKSILSEQKGGFLASYTHSTSPYTGCQFGQSACGLYCYAQYLPNWQYSLGQQHPWGSAIAVKRNAADLLAKELRRTKDRNPLRVFMSPTADPYQPVERDAKVTRAMLEVFAQYDDLGLLVIQTRSPLAERDFDIIRQIKYAWLSVTIETNSQGYLSALKRGGPTILARMELVKKAVAAGIRTQIAVAPCLPYNNGFAGELVGTGAHRIIVDNLVEGDGGRGQRTQQSPFAQVAGFDWRNTDYAKDLYTGIRRAQEVVGGSSGWSAEGFNGIPSILHPKQGMLW